MAAGIDGGASDPTPPRSGRLYVQLQGLDHYPTNRRTEEVRSLKIRHPMLAEYLDQQKQRPDSGSETECLYNLIFPEGQGRLFHIANLTVDSSDNHNRAVSLRAAVEPHEGWPFPPDVTIAARAHWDLRPGSPRLSIQGFSDVASDPQRPYEESLDAVIFHCEQGYPSKEGNVLLGDLIDQLPPISAVTRDRLKDWFDFLKWRQRLLVHQIEGVRYVDLAADPTTDSLVFTVVAENEAELRRLCRAVGRTEGALVYKVSDSNDPYSFIIDRLSPPPRSYRLGEVEPLTSTQAWLPPSDCTWVEAVQGQVTVPLTRPEAPGAAEEGQDGEDLPELSNRQRRALQDLPSVGFICTSATSDITLIKRQRAAVLELQRQGGFAPYLSTYVFDSRQARSPRELPAIDTWSRPDLNGPQREAVRRIVAAPDLCLIQGPPGTGKTTVIAEAIAQLTRRGETVLLASQTHTAVDNALSRLTTADPSIRAVRLTRNPDKVRGEGKQFVDSNALRRYYGSLAAFSEQIARQWTDDDKRIDTIEAWLRAAEPRCRELARAEDARGDCQQAHNRATHDLARLRRQYDATEARNTRSRARRAMLQKLAHFVRSGGDSSGLREGPLPERGSRELAEAIFKVRKQHIWFGSLPATWDESADKNELLIDLLTRWFRVHRELDALDQWARTLQGLAESDAPDAQTQAEIAEIQRELDRLTDSDSDSPEVVRTWKELRKRKRALVGTLPQPPDRSALAVFDDEKKLQDQIARLTPTFTRPFTKDTKLGKALAKRVSALRAAEAEISARQMAYAHTVDLQVRDCHEEPVDRTRETRLRQDVDSLKEALELAETNLDDAIRQAHTVTGGISKGDSPAPDGLKSTDFSRQIRLRRDELETVRTKRVSQTPERTEWEPILNAWIADLRDAQAGARDWDQFGDLWLPECSVVAVTCNEDPRTLDDRGLTCFDVAIIDEVSKATPLEMLLPLMRARRSVLVGDHRQLPPMFREGPDAEAFSDIDSDDGDAGNEASLTRDNLNRYRKLVTASFFKEHFEHADDLIRQTLTTQYRMHPQIMDLVNNFYEGQLRNGILSPDAARAHGLHLTDKYGGEILGPEQHAIWIDTTCDLTGKQHKEDRANGKTLRSNRLEAQLLMRTLRQINDQCRSLGFTPERRKQVGVVSFYANQRKMLRKEMAREFQSTDGRPDCLDVEIDTVVNYQGREKSVILVSLVRNYGLSLDSKKTRSTSRQANVSRYEYLNVAFSRAQELLVIFGACGTFKPIPIEMPQMSGLGTDTRPVYRDIIESLDRKALVIKAQRLADPVPTAGATRRRGPRGGPVK